MGAEARCVVLSNGKSAKGTARLEADALEFHGREMRLSIPLTQIKKVAARGSMLSVTFNGGAASFELGAAAATWAAKICSPPSRLDKLGVKAGQRVALVNLDDDQLAQELESAGAIVAHDSAARNSDVIFYGASAERDLARIEQLKASLQPAGALWVVRQKGRPEISERSVMAAGKAAGLVDVKVVRFSATHTAEKFVIPVRDRGSRS